MQSSDRKSVPLFKDLGKPASDIFTTPFLVDKLKLTAKNVSSPKFEAKTEFSQDLSSKVNKGEVSLISTFGGKKFEEKLNTDSVLSSRAIFQCCKFPGLEAEVNSDYNIKLDKCTPSFKLSYKNMYLNSGLTLTKGPDQTYKSEDGKMNFKSLVVPTKVELETVCGHKEYFVGLKGTLQKDSGFKPVNSVLALYYKPNEFECLGKLVDMKTFNGSLFFNKTDDLKLALMCDFEPKKSDTLLTIGGSYRVDDLTTANAKFSSTYELGLSVKYTLSKWSKLTLSGDFKLDKLSEPVHKFGVGLELNA